MTEQKKIESDDVWLTKAPLWPPSKSSQHNNNITKFLQRHLTLLIALGILGFIAFAYVAVECGRAQALHDRAQGIIRY